MLAGDFAKNLYDPVTRDDYEKPCHRSGDCLLPFLQLLGVTGSGSHYNAKTPEYQNEEADNTGQNEGIADDHVDNRAEGAKRGERQRKIFKIHVCSVYLRSMAFQEALASVKRDIDEKLHDFFAKKRQEAGRISPHSAILVDQVANLTLRGGKRTRAFLVWVGHEAARESKVKSKTSEYLMHAMMGLELFQSFALIHDDIIDGDTLRRGAPSVHVRVGVPMAILAGDLALAWADELMKKGKRKTENGKSEDVYQKMKEEVILGQSLDVLAKEGKPSADRATINRYKTAWYTVIRPLQIGAAVAGASGKSLASFVPYGLAVGEAYQLRDDFLDGAMSEEEFQKSVQKLVVPKSATILLTDFVRFALTRST